MTIAFLCPASTRIMWSGFRSTAERSKLLYCAKFAREKMAADGTLPSSAGTLSVTRRASTAVPKTPENSDDVPSKKKRRMRLDELCAHRYPHLPPVAINSWILQGKVLVGDRPVLKPGTMLPPTSTLRLTASQPRFVCRGGLKLQAAVEHFCVPVAGAVALDAGISTGGFTDCLLQNGAGKVYGVDVGYGQVHERIRTDPRVVILERVNLRLLPSLPDEDRVDLVTLDLSFISILSVLPAVRRLSREESGLLTLIKPQFEARRDQAVNRVVAGVEQAGFRCWGTIPSPIRGADGNTEFVAYFTR